MNRWNICDCCGGEGRVDNPAFSQGFTASEWADEDPEFREAYLGGAYDVPCRECNGSGKVRSIESMTFAEKRALVEKRRREYVCPIQAAERRMGA